MFFPDKPTNIIADCDEILTDISPLWTKMIHDDQTGFFRDYFDLHEGLGAHDSEEVRRMVLSRPEFHLNKWLLKKDLSLTEAQNLELFNRFYSLYDNDEFYAQCSPTKMCQGLFMLSQQKFTDKIFVVTRTSEGTREGKRRFLETFLPSDKVEIVFVGSKEKKSQYIKEMGNVSVIMEDELSNIHDIVDNCKNLRQVDIYIPLTGYNKPDADFFDKLNKNEFKAIYYPIFEGEQP